MARVIDCCAVSYVQSVAVESLAVNSKTLFYKDCSLGSVRNLTTSPCSATDE